MSPVRRGPTLTPQVPAFRGAYWFLSNRFPAEVHVDGLACPTSEHAFHVLKTLDLAARRWILETPDPLEAKRRGKQVPLRPHWQTQLRLPAMERVVWDKFTRHPELARQLVATDPYWIEETNTWRDTFWGMVDGRGANHLGLLLMHTRDRLLAPAHAPLGPWRPWPETPSDAAAAPAPVEQLPLF